MKTAVVVDCVRTPVGRAHKDRGYFRDVRSDDLAIACVKGLLDRTGIAPSEIEDVVLGCTQQTLEQGLNVARNVAIISGLAIEAGGTTVNRLCGSSLQALNQATHSILAGSEDVQIVGGLEHMHHLPLDFNFDINPKLYNRTSKGAMMMGVTAEFLAQTYDIPRATQDEYALRSHQKAAAAQANGEFRREIIPMSARDDEGNRILADRDQCVRPDASLAALAALDPAFMPKVGTVTAGNSSPLNDGAAAMLIMSDEKARALGMKPLVKIRGTAVAGVDPCVMGTGPVAATQKVLRRTGLQLKDIDLIEINEAFASQVIACARLLKIDESKLNVRGGAIAIGHPLGASGARISATLVNAMIDRKATLGLATMCIGGGQGIATVFERI